MNIENDGWKTGKYPLFLGQELGLHDTMNRPYPELFDKFKLLKSLDWTEDEIDLEKSRLDFLSCDKNSYDVMIKTLAFQYEADSLASRSIIANFAPFISNSDLSQMMLRWSDNECFTEGAECLTKDGWVDLKNIKQGQLVYSLNTSTNSLELVPVEGVVVKDYDGDVLEFKNEAGNILYQQVTPNHRMIYKSYYTDRHSFELAKDIKLHGGNRLILGAKSEDKGSRLSLLEKVAIMFQADGSVSEKYTGARTGLRPVRVALKKRRKIEDAMTLKTLWEDEGMKCKVSEEDSRGYIHFTFWFPAESNHLLSKSFDWVTFDKGLTWMEEFLEEVKKWDSCVRKEDNFWRYINTDKEAVDTVQTIGHLCGLSSSIYEASATDVRKTCWQLTLKNRNYIAGNSVLKTSSAYKGKVRCVTVKHGNFLVRQKGLISLTGNCLHATTYSEIIRQCIANPDDIFEEILNDKNITDRSAVIGEAFSKLKVLGAKYTLDKDSVSDYEVKETLLLSLVALYCLEAMEFMASFACTFALAERDLFEGIASLVQKIMIDETVHTEMDEVILDILLKEDSWKEVYVSIKPKVQELVDSVYQQELSWSEYIFSEGRSVVGLTEGLLKDWVTYRSDAVYNKLGLTKPYTVVEECPLPWMESKWLDIDANQQAAQEADLNNYRLNSVIDDVTDKMVYDFGNRSKTLPAAVSLYSKEECPFCVKLKAFLKKKGVIYEEIDVVENTEAKEALLSLGLETVPQVFDFQGNYLGDCTSILKNYEQ